MTKRPEALARQQERSHRRREQVLAAASVCFRREGFHAGSVNRIAAEAGMSVGHLYKYFDSKEAIITALCEEGLSEFMSHTPIVPLELNSDVAALVAASLRDFDVLIDRDRATLILEMLLEAGRSEAIAAIVLAADERLRCNQQRLLAPFFEGLSAAEKDARLEMVLLVLQGLSMRIASNPTLNVDVLKSGFEIVLRALLRK